MSNCHTEEIRTDECIATRDEGYRKCSDWGFFSFLCVAWTWVENLVCVAYQYIQKTVCEGIDILTTFIAVLVSLIEVVLGVIGGLLGAIVDGLLSIPIFGRALEWLLNIGRSILSFGAAFFDSILALAGIMPEKKMFLLVVIQRDSRSEPIISDRTVIYRSVQYLINCFREELNIRVLPYKLIQFKTPFSADSISNDDFIVVDDESTPDRDLDLCCDECEAGNNLLRRGGVYSAKITRNNFFGGGRRLLGWGSPVLAFAVRSFTDGKAGCSLGPLTDFVTVRFQNSDPNFVLSDLTSEKSLGSVTDLAHEVGHCCSLPHFEDAENLMKRGPNRKGHLTMWQKVLVRSSRHVTYL
jgi:hypothetical protein